MPKKRGLDLPGQTFFPAPASLWKRAAAFFIDLLIINFTIFSAFRSLVIKLLPQSMDPSQMYAFIIASPQLQKSLLKTTLAMSIFALLYFAFAEYKTHTTPGKYLFNLFVATDNSLSFFQCLSRSLFLIPLFPFFLLWIVDPLFLAFTRTNQRLSELLSRSRTVEYFPYQQGGR